MENKKTKIISIVAIVALALTLITATFAYFQAQTGEGSQTDIRINANTVDTLSFETGSAISLSMDQESFASGKGNATGTTFAKAILTANNKTNIATEHYYFYFNINKNTFAYTQNENTPEILLTVKDGSNNEITSIDGLTYKTVTDGKGATVKGFDITNKRGLITLFNNREITTTSTKTEQWNITVTFINYNVNQSANAGKSFSAKLMIQKEEYKQPLAEYIISQYTGTQGENSLYYHDSSLTNGAGDNSYRYAGGDYVLTDIGKATGATYTTVPVETTGVIALISFYCDERKEYVGSGCSSSSTPYYLIKGDTTQYQTYSEALSASVEKGYLTKDNVNNFVCFGTNTSPCPTDNLYRIIGVFGNNVKLIKYDYANSNLLGTDGDYSTNTFSKSVYSSYMGNLTAINVYYWNNLTQTNIWSTSLLNKTNLNTNFINYLGTEWANKIATTTWKVGGNTYNNIANVEPSVSYKNEIVNPTPGSTSTTGETEYKAKIGLMYVSDYGFAASQDHWGRYLMDTYAAAMDNNWMYMGLYELTISRTADTLDCAFRVVSRGNVDEGRVTINYAVRPSFSLESSVTYVSGDGSQSSPLRLS